MTMFEEGCWISSGSMNSSEEDMAVIKMAMGMGYQPSMTLEELQYLEDDQIQRQLEHDAALTFIDNLATKEGFGVSWIDGDLMCYPLDDETE